MKPGALLLKLITHGDTYRPMTPHEPEWDPVEIDARAEEIADDTLLTEREAQVWLLQRQGLTRDSIATELGISIHSVDEYRKRRTRKFREAEATLRARDEVETTSKEELDDG